MRQRATKAVLVAVMVLFGQMAAIAADRPDWRWLVVADGPDADSERGALVGALRFLPRLPARVAVIDAAEAKPNVRTTLLRLDAFVIKGSPVVYVVKQSALLRGAIAGSALYTRALATVLWHEMAHAEGADEREARKWEQALWTTFIRDQQVDAVEALRYLKALDSRPEDQVLALR